MKKTLSLLIALAMCAALAACGNGGDAPHNEPTPAAGGQTVDDFTLAELSNPFLGKWQSDIPSAGMTLIFDYKADGTFDYEMVGVPAEEGGVGSGGYVVYDNIQVTWLDFEGAAAYTFEVVDNDTINVTELGIDENGGPVTGSTAPFTRVADSPVNKADIPFELANPFLGAWNSSVESEGSVFVLDYSTNGTVGYDWTMGEQGGNGIGCYIVYSDKMVIYYPEYNSVETYTFAPIDADNLSVTELAITESGEQERGETAQFIRVTAEINPDVTARVVRAESNRAGVYFLATPDTDAYSAQLAAAAEHGFTWSTALAVLDGSETSPVSGQRNQLAAPNSGFAFNLKTNAPPDGLRAAIGFNSIFNFTAENLGEDLYAQLVAALNASDMKFGDWVLPPADTLTDLGLHVYTTYNGEVWDITDRVSYGLNIADTDAGVLFSYGAVMVDGEIADFDAEGFPLLVSDEEELIWRDGAADGAITAQWWIGIA
ncbi:MAG: hypothetical protein LBN00_01630 [Oscillospiraceae bacterium]|jgi:hypothetical protein|nr:hypothetical protein [Oscillospiraceae bacterium]